MINENHENHEIKEGIEKKMESDLVEERSQTYIDKIFDEVKEYNDNYQFQKAVELLLECAQIQETLQLIKTLKYGETLHKIGLTYYYLDDLNKSLSYYQRGLKVKEQVTGKKSKEYANTLNNIGNTYLDLNNLDESLSSLKTCLKIYSKTDGK